MCKIYYCKHNSKGLCKIRCEPSEETTCQHYCKEIDHRTSINHEPVKPARKKRRRE